MTLPAPWDRPTLPPLTVGQVVAQMREALVYARDQSHDPRLDARCRTSASSYAVLLRHWITALVALEDAD